MKISIVIPVYNVEKYLRECLDSVINQTLRDIQIICVNDGSPDGSPAILEEYAAKDSRIMVIHQKNAGLSAARNAAYPYIKGKYTLFVDSDDWIDHTLCEKVFAIAENENADMTFFFFQRVPESKSPIAGLEMFLQTHIFEEVDRTMLLNYMMAWSKLWKTKFLLDNHIIFPEGICYEDNVAHWHALLFTPKLAIVNSRLYFYRINPNSIMSDKTLKNQKDKFVCYDLIRMRLIAFNQYHGEWKQCYLKTKLSVLHDVYRSISRAEKNECRLLLEKAITDDDVQYLQNDSSMKGRLLRAFYNSLDGSLVYTVQYLFFLFFRKIKSFFILSGVVRRK